MDFLCNLISPLTSYLGNKINQKTCISLAIIAAVITAVALGWLLARGTIVGETIERVEYPLIDLRHRWYVQRADVSDEIVLLVITDETLTRFEDNLGRWPWPRRVWGAIIQHLSEARAVKFDVGFWEKSPLEISPQIMERMRRQLAQLQRYQTTEPERAEEIYQQLEASFNDLAVSDDVLLGQATEEAGQVVHSLTSEELLPSVDTLPPLAEQIINRYGWQLSGDVKAAERGSMVVPIEELAATTDQIAHIDFFPDQDGIARRIQPFVGSKLQEGETQYVPILGLTGHLRGMEREANYEERYLEIGEHRLPIDHRGKVPIRYRAEFREYTAIPVETVLEPLITGADPIYDPEWFEDRVVLIGATAAGLFDLQATPTDPVQPGMGIHAATYEMLRTGDYLEPERPEQTIITIVAVGILVGIISIFLGPLLGLLATLVTLVLLFVAGFQLFALGYTINLSLPLLTGILIYGGLTTHNVFYEQQQKKFIREAFQHYLPESVLETILADPDRLVLEARRRKVTVLFMDIAGFTSLSEGLEATEVANRLNELLTGLSRCVFKHEGIIDKFIGDELMAEFGLLEVEPPEPETRACRAADDMLKELAKYNERNPDDPLDIRIGMNTGWVAAGNMGSEDLFDYTVIADAVNLGSRLEGVNKVYGTKCMLSGETAKGLPEKAIIREIDRVRVKGRDEPVTIHQWMGWRNEVGEDTIKKAEIYGNALNYYREEKFQEALDELTELPEDDTAARWLTERCRELIEAPPADDWEPVTTLTSK